MEGVNFGGGVDSNTLFEASNDDLDLTHLDGSDSFDQFLPKKKPESKLAHCCALMCLTSTVLGVNASINVALLRIGLAVLRQNYSQYDVLDSATGNQIAALTAVFSTTSVFVANLFLKKCGFMGDVVTNVQGAVGVVDQLKQAGKGIASKRTLALILFYIGLGVASIKLACWYVDPEQSDLFVKSTATISVGASTITAGLVGLAAVCVCCALPAKCRERHNDAAARQSGGIEGAHYRQFQPADNGEAYPYRPNADTNVSSFSSQV